MNLALEPQRARRARSDHRRGHRRGAVLDRGGNRRGADPRVLLDQHQGAARLLDRAVQCRRAHALPGRAHPDPSRQLHRHRAADSQAARDREHAARRRVRRQRRLCGRRHASSGHRARRADLRRRPHRRLDRQSRASFGLRRSRPCPHLSGRPAHPDDPALQGGRAAEGRARSHPAELPGAARAAVGPARADGGKPRRRAALPGAVRQIWHRGRARGRRGAARLCRAQDARRYRCDPGRHLSLRGRVRQSGDRRACCRSPSRSRSTATRCGCTSTARRRCAPAST